MTGIENPITSSKPWLKLFFVLIVLAVLFAISCGGPEFMSNEEIQQFEGRFGAIGQYRP